MMTVTFGLLAVSCFFLWRREAQWGWAVVMIALILGIVIFMGDVDFSFEAGSPAMKDEIVTPDVARVLNFAGMLAMIGVLLGAYVYQFSYRELPCTLCQLQRVAMVAVALGAAMNVMLGPRARHYAVCLVSAMFGLAISIRQTLLHINPFFDTKHRTTDFGRGGEPAIWPAGLRPSSLRLGHRAVRDRHPRGRHRAVVPEPVRTEQKYRRLAEAFGGSRRCCAIRRGVDRDADHVFGMRLRRLSQ